MVHGIIIPLNLLCNSHTIRLSALNKRQRDIKPAIITQCYERLVCLGKLEDDMYTTECNGADVLWEKLLRKREEMNVTSAFHKACR